MSLRWLDADYDVLYDIMENDPNDFAKVAQVAAEIRKPEQSVCVSLLNFRAYLGSLKRASEPEAARGSTDTLASRYLLRLTSSQENLSRGLDMLADSDTPEDTLRRLKLSRDISDVDVIFDKVKAEAERAAKEIHTLHEKMEESQAVVKAKKEKLKVAVE